MVLDFVMVRMTKERYEAYLQTDHWEDFSRTIRKERGQCARCGIDDREAYRKYRQRLNVHHKTYERLGHERPEDVELLCYGCHMSQHGRFDWFAIAEKFAMPEVRKIPLYCENCEKPTGEYVYNFDEVEPSLCWECREGALR